MRARARRDYCVRWARRFAVGIVVIALAFGGYRAYGAWRERNLARQTREFFAHGDYQSAVLVARHLLQLNQNNVAACRVMAETAELSGRGEAISWRQRVVALEPNVLENTFALAATALRFGQIELARKVLEGVAPGTRNTVKYYQLAGGIAVMEKQPGAAEAHFSAALKIEPKNSQLALNLATVRLALPDVNTNEKARADLARLADEPAVRLEALRALAADALGHNSRNSAERWAAQLKSEKGATFSDALLYLEAVQGTEMARPAILDVQSSANKSSVAASTLITWMNRHAMATAAIEWGLTLPKQILDEQPVPLAIAESYSFLEDWKAMQAWVDGKNWGEYECFRLAVQSHAMHRLGPADRPSMESDTVWHAALRAAQSRTERLAAIARLAEGWSYTEDAEEAWWIIANGNDNARVALDALQRLYKSKQNSHGLLRVAKRALELNPADLIAANNCASLGLLLTGDTSARRLAAKLHRENPTNAVFSATYAFALHLAGKTGDALKVMGALKEAQLRYPVLAAYYFVMLVDDGQMERAHSFLSAANQAALLPEEQQLLTAATRKLLVHDSRKSVAAVESLKR